MDRDVERQAVVLGLRVRVDLCHLEEILEDIGVAAEAREVESGVATLELQLDFDFLVKVLQDVKVAIPDREEDRGPAYG